MIRRPPRSTRTDTLFPYTTLFRSGRGARIGTSDMSDASRAWLRTFRFGKPAATAELERSRDSGDGPKGERRQPRIIHILSPHLCRCRGDRRMYITGRRSEESRVGEECVSMFGSRW